MAGDIEGGSDDITGKPGVKEWVVLYMYNTYWPRSFCTQNAVNLIRVSFSIIVLVHYCTTAAMVATSYLASNIHHTDIHICISPRSWRNCVGWGRGGGASLEGKFKMLVSNLWMGFAYMLYMYVCTIQYSTGQYMISIITTFWQCSLVCARSKL